jgi:coenzyme F420-reducing hydrogenase gamma subunit
MSKKPRIAIFDFTCCEGCQLQIVNLEEELMDLIAVVDPVEWREAISDRSDEFDAALVEGSITRAEDEDRLKEIRLRCRMLIALGACATTGGVNKLKNRFDVEDVRRCVYGEAENMPHLNTEPTKALDEVVKVDWKVHGCPINNKEAAHMLRCFLVGRRPHIPTYPVCVECKMKENTCRFEYGEICLGPITRAGCDAKCPSGGFWCYGCRGYVEDPNVNAAKEIMKQYGKTIPQLRSRMLMFGSRQEHTI